MSLLISGLAVAALFTTTLFPARTSIWASLIIWVVRTVTMSLLFRTFLGPFILRLLSNRLRVRSISLRSIKGIYFRSGTGILRIDRIGLSFHRPSPQGTSRFSVKVEGLKLDVTDLNSSKGGLNSPTRPRRTPRQSLGPSLLTRRAWLLSCFLYTRIYTTLDPYLRPVIRTVFVSTLRFIIRALPTLTQGLDFELISASITLSEVPGVEFVLGKAKLQTSVTLSIPPTAANTGNEGTHAETSRHRRFGSVATWNARLASSVKRTWDRAWGATEVAATVSLNLQQITGNAYRPLLQLLNIPLEEHDRYDFLTIPHIHFSTSARLDPHKGIQPQSVEVVLGLDHVVVDIDVLGRILTSLQRSKSKVVEKPAPLPSHTPLLSSSPSLSALTGWGSPLSAMSSNSQLMGVLSASMRFRRHHKTHPIHRVNSQVVSSRLAIMKAIHFNVATLALKHREGGDQATGADVFTATFQSISVNANLSQPERNTLHREWLGRSSSLKDTLTPDMYAVCVSVREVSLDRDSSGLIKDHLRVARLGPVAIDTVISQYPSPWLQGPTFLAGDPNSQLVFVNVSLGELEITERLEVLQSILKNKAPPKQRSESHPVLPTVLSPVPRVQFGLHLGKIRIRLISSGSVASTQPFALEARTDALVVNVTSNFVMVPDHQFGKAFVVPDHSPLVMHVGFEVVLDRTFVKVHTESSSLKSPVDGSITYSGEPILSLDAVHFIGNVDALGEMAEEAGMVVTIDVPSALVTTSCSTDALSVELWQPDAIGALSTVLRALPPSPKGKPSSSPSYILDQLPSGLVASFSIARVMVFVTGPDLAPGEDLNISRGVAAHTGVSLSYCAVRGSHVGRLPDSSVQKQRRLQLSLPDELMSKAHSHLTSSFEDETVHAFVRVLLLDTAFRDALATGLSPDDPYGTGDSNQDYRSKEYLKVKTVAADVVLSGHRHNGDPVPDSTDECQITVSIPSVIGSMHLAHIYNILLATNTLTSLRPLPTAPHSPYPPKSSTLTFGLSCAIDRIRLLWDFPLGSQLYLRAKTVSTVLSSAPGIHAGWDSIVLATSLDSEGGESTKVWHEVARLVDWEVSIRPDIRPVPISVDADTGRIRIPFGFVLADLILDVIVTAKSIKHLVTMVPSGLFSDPPTPEAEDAKSMPDLKVRVRSFSAEVVDESIESRLGLLWKAGSHACRIRLEREEAFQAKVEAILAATNPGIPSARVESDFQFGAGHSIPIAEAQNRLWYIHSGTWKVRFSDALQDQERRERILGGEHIPLYEPGEHDLVDVQPPKTVPPMFRIFMDQLSLHITRPSFPESGIPDFLFAEGGGIPRDTKYSLLVPMHLNFTLASLRIAYRNYPLPLLNIPRHSRGLSSFEFDTDFIIAEEMGTDRSVQRINCAIVKEHTGIHGASPLSIAVLKTIMPVKTYANPIIKVSTDDVTDFTWGVSYGPVTQDFMRVVDTLSHAPLDNSPAIGFWDKLRLIFHWRLQISFDDEVHLHLKGSLNPYELKDHGAGFALCWRGNPKLLVNQDNEQNELMQLVSESMLITVPSVEEAFGDAATPGAHTDNSNQFSTTQTHDLPRKSRNHCKVCAKLTNGVRFGIGIALERSCGPECPNCTGRSFQRQCRFFTFKPHYGVMLESKSKPPAEKSPEDSYNGFRSDFIHLSISLASSLNGARGKGFSSIHLSPGLFAHFWAWWSLFDGKSLPIRQGSLYKHKRPLSPKFGQHLATIKYMISLGRLFVSHAYMDNSREAWTDGVTPFVGVKAMIDLFQADMHQRAQESTIAGPDGTSKTIVHKPFYAIEVVMKGLELRALLAIFSEPLKQLVPLESSPLGDSYRSRTNIPIVDPKSPWVDLDDFVEIGWSAEGTPVLHLLPAAFCPRFTYFRKTWDNSEAATENRVEVSKFGSEDTHVCLLGKESSVPQVQMGLAKQRISELRRSMTSKTRANTEKMIALLNDYMTHLQVIESTSHNSGPSGPQSYYMPSDTVSPEDWAAFNNVYQVHCPQIFLDNTIRDIMMQYYYCSRVRRGFEYHMATRAVKFIRDQANTVVEAYQQEGEKSDTPAANVHAAAIALRKLLTGDNDDRTSVEVAQAPVVDLTTQEIDPTSGWSEGVSIRKGHFCLLLKPQIVLRSEASPEAVCILAAVQGKLQSYAVMDNANADDPVSGKVMSRNYASITGLQTFSPSAANKSGEGCVPLEVLIDLRCENSLFDRLVPQTDATFHYDKFNQLRLQNNVISVARTSQDSSAIHNHLRSQTDLIRFHVPRFTVSANDRHFQAISTILTSLVLFSDAALKVRSDRLEKMLFSYDFTDMASAANVVEDLQSRLRHAVEMKRDADHKLHGFGEEGEVEKLKIEAHILLLSEELDFVFEAIKMAQDKANDRAGQKSALLLHASSSEISWRMLDRHDQLLAKLALRDINFYWLSRQDSSTVNNLALGDLQAFDGAADAEWTEILSKYEEKSDHPLVKKNLFLLADWTVLPPVGGITIYEAFDLALHPMRLQIDTRVGKKIMEYVWPARRNRPDVSPTTPDTYRAGPPSAGMPTSPRRASLEIPSPIRQSLDTGRLVAPPLRRLGTSRSFTDLRNSRQETLQVSSRLHRTKSSDALFVFDGPSSPVGQNSKGTDETRDKPSPSKESDDAAEMKTRSSQKTFVWVRVASLHLMLSIMKENSFLCRDARIRTRVLEYRNQTWSFEELVDQFIPSGRNWKGWVRMAFNQPLVPVLPVARELISKTKWVSSSKSHNPNYDTIKRKGTTKLLPFVGSSRKSSSGSRTPSSANRELPPEEPIPPMPSIPIPPTPSDTEQSTDEHPKARKRSRSRTRVLNLFKRKHHHESHPSQSSVDSDASVSTASSVFVDHSMPPVPPIPVTASQSGRETSVNLEPRPIS